MTLDTFEGALLHELRDVVADRRTRTRPARRPLLLGGAGVAAAAAVATFVSVGPVGPGAQPAFAISNDAHGDTVVVIHRTDQLPAVEKALRARGINVLLTVSGGPLVPLVHPLPTACDGKVSTGVGRLAVKLARQGNDYVLTISRDNFIHALRSLVKGNGTRVGMNPADGAIVSVTPPTHGGPACTVRVALGG
jgi:hypothetical protein